MGENGEDRAGNWELESGNVEQSEILTMVKEYKERIDTLFEKMGTQPEPNSTGERAREIIVSNLALGLAQVHVGLKSDVIAPSLVLGEGNVEAFGINEEGEVVVPKGRLVKLLELTTTHLELPENAKYLNLAVVSWVSFTAVMFHEMAHVSQREQRPELFNKSSQAWKNFENWIDKIGDNPDEIGVNELFGALKPYLIDEGEIEAEEVSVGYLDQFKIDEEMGDKFRNKFEEMKKEYIDKTQKNIQTRRQMGNQSNG